MENHNKKITKATTCTLERLLARLKTVTVKQTKCLLKEEEEEGKFLGLVSEVNLV